MVMTWGWGDNVHFFMSQPNDISTLAFYDAWSPSQLIGGTWPIQYTQPSLSSHSQQMLNLFVQDDGQVFMIGSYNELFTAPVTNGDDMAYLYRVQPLGPNNVVVTRLAEKHMYCSAAETGSNCNFNAAVGPYVAPDGELILYACTHDNDAPGGATGMAEFRHYWGHRTATGGPCTAFVELYQDTNGWAGDDRSITFDITDRLHEDWADLSKFETVPGSLQAGFNDHASSAVWLLPPGCTCRLYEHANYQGKYLDLVGTGVTQTIGNLHNTAWTVGSGTVGDEVSSMYFIGNCPSPGAYVPNGTTPSIAVGVFAVLGGPCAVITVQAGTYSETGIIDKYVRLRAAGGPVTIGQ
jgi:hypothetical protein